MPVKLDECELCNVARPALSTLIPIGIAGVGWWVYARKKEQTDWFGKLKAPSWIVTNPRILAPIDFAVLSPIGYAAHLVCKEGQGADRQLALGLYGTGLFVWLAGIPAFSHTKDLKCWFGVETAAAAIFGATAAAFFKINNTSGLLLLPLTVWLTYGAIGLATMIQANPESKPTK